MRMKRDFDVVVLDLSYFGIETYLPVINQKGNKSKNQICYSLFEQYLLIHGLINALLKPAFLLQFLYA